MLSSDKNDSQLKLSVNMPASKNKKSKSSILSAEQILEAYTIMLRARLNDAKAIVLYKQNKCHFQISCAGHEAVQVAASLIFQPGKDWFYPYYRDMALCAGLGMTDREFMLNCLNKEADPNSHGRQMPMHYGHKKLNIVNQSSPTGTQYLQAVGCALALKKKGDNSVVYVSSGEGACAQGDFHEAINWASRDKLPVVFLIQNNLYAISVHVSEQLAGESVYKIVAGYENLNRSQIDGSSLFDSYETINQAYNYTLAGKGPSLIEANVPRLQSHSISDNHLKYRSVEDLANENKRCPIYLLKEYILKNNISDEQELSEIEVQIKDEVDQACDWAESQPNCSKEKALLHTYYNSMPALEIAEQDPGSKDSVFLVDAINHALDEELARNPDTYIFGQDVAHGKGGVFTATGGLTAKHGADRVFNAQLAESSIVGVAIGMSTYGLKPIAEIQFGDYVWTAMMQIRNELAMLNYRSAGDFTCPAVIRIPVGGYIHGGSYHSQNIESTFAHFPGLYVVYPSNATDAKGLLKSAIRAKDPVLFLEHKGLYRQVYAKGVEGDANFLTPIGKAKVVMGGSDLTVVTWGAIVHKALTIAKALKSEGINLEIIDLRTIVPLDKATVFESVKKTGKVLIAHEDVEFMGFGAEISALIADECFQYLDAPIKRLGMKYVAAVSHSPEQEDVVLPQNKNLEESIRKILAY